jgi:cytochrome c-type biogenesis protein CcmH/NrfG
MRDRQRQNREMTLTSMAAPHTNPVCTPAHARVRAGLVAMALTLISACATQPDKTEGTYDDPVSPDGTIRHNVDNRAVWEQAEEARRNGEIEKAAAKLEKAVGMAPEDPVLWSRLAELRLQQRAFAVAENLAAKSNALAGKRRLLRYRNWLMIAEARRRRGDDEGAQKAKAKAGELEGDG